jgi:glyoxylate/hydroxypyruvate reductase A
VEADILSCLDDGTLQAATLDVFEREPLGADSAFWTQSNVTVTPHNAAMSAPEAIVGLVVEGIRAHEAGEPLKNAVDRRLGY